VRQRPKYSGRETFTRPLTSKLKIARGSFRIRSCRKRVPLLGPGI
jgi:hypothetical protein